MEWNSFKVPLLLILPPRGAQVLLFSDSHALATLRNYHFIANPVLSVLTSCKHHLQKIREIRIIKRENNHPCPTCILTGLIWIFMIVQPEKKGKVGGSRRFACSPCLFGSLLSCGALLAPRRKRSRLFAGCWTACRGWGLGGLLLLLPLSPTIWGYHAISFARFIAILEMVLTWLAV